ncbi:MAG: phosphate ABC transporter ATP-binding protein [Candidatus Methanoperedens nitroreducens]|uniref:Phosphate ABC transporter ATP-binding protein n=1 Tax=Candidatus Methanoperedens nitratireducens TaxID=1392998 RepID=A0A0P8DUZ6_9EURY|nr:MAG: phosphate ABC transporter ATP-binding protein [Candidatus Methanoperedens sp. BLZ1]
MTETQISIQNLNVTYNGNRALKNISVEIPKKQITAIIGPSGCGKSTMLKCMNRLIDMTDNVTFSGKIIIDNEDVFDKKQISLTSGKNLVCWHRSQHLFQCQYMRM